MSAPIDSSSRIDGVGPQVSDSGEELSMAFVVTARWTAKEGQAAVVAAALEKLAGPSRAEPGLLLYQLHRDPENPHVFLIYEQYRTKADYEAHGASEHFQRFGVGEAFPSLESRERGFYETWDT